MAMMETIVVVVLMLILLLILLLACKPWRFFFASSRRSVEVDDIERPLFSNDSDLPSSERLYVPGSCNLEGSSAQIDGGFSSPTKHGLVCKQRIPLTDAHVSQASSLILDVISESSEDLSVGETLGRSVVSGWPVEDRQHVRKEEPNYNLASVFDDDRYRISLPQDIVNQRSSLSLEVISGPSRGLRYSLQSTNTSRFPFTLGRVPPSDLLLKDNEVSGKHALINWNLNKLKWELVDMGSLNGTLLNSHVIHHPESGHRRWSEPIELSSGDIITLGTTSKVHIEITWHAEHHIPTGVGLASDPMSLRRGGKKLPMEDVCYYQWPLPEVDQFGLFGIFDGHGGAGAAKSASKTLPEMVANMLSVSDRREMVLSLCDASQVLRDAFLHAEAALNHQYEGCTATVLLVWVDHQNDFFAQCANVGDSACVMNIGEKHIIMTEDHRVTSPSERNRLRRSGPPLKDGETRLCGVNISRMLGDKFLKGHEPRFSSEPHVSQVVHVPRGSHAFALMASDGLWDVISIKKAVQLVLQTQEKYAVDKENSAGGIANFMLSEARTLRTKDNTSILYIDFDTIRTACNFGP